MTHPVIFLAEARLELIGAQDWYGRKVDALGAAFGREIARVVERIAEQPLHFPLVVGGLRRARLARFPYAIYFRAAPDGIVVVACFHSRRDSRTLPQRS